MDTVFVIALASGAGGTVGLIAGNLMARLWHLRTADLDGEHSDKDAKGKGRTGSGRSHLRHALVEIGGATSVGMCVGFARLSGNLALAFLAGSLWSLLCQAIRVGLTNRTVRGIARLKNWWAIEGAQMGAATADVCKLAVGWPGVFWVKFLDRIGLLNLPEGQIGAYDRYRTHVAWQIQFGPAFGALKDRVIRYGSRSRSPDWFNNRLVWPLVCISIVGVVLYALALEPRVGYPYLHTASPFPYLIEAVVILAMLLQCPYPLVDETHEPDESGAARSFHRCWYYLQASWVAMYLIYFASKYFPRVFSSWQLVMPTGELDFVWEVSKHLANNINTYYSIMCYCALHDPFFISSTRVPLGTRARFFGGPTVLALAGAEIAFYALGWTDKIVCFDWIAGFAAGVGLALMVGRLESPLFNAPVPLIAALYFYAVLQGTVGVFRGAEVVESVAFALALPLKCLMLILVAWLMGSGKLHAYMKELHRIKLAEENW